MRSTFFCLLVVLCFVRSNVSAQNTDYRPNLIPPSPDAAALGKYAEYPVGLYTGVLPVSIPLYTVNDGGLQLPLYLSYHASGNKVDEAASFVGLGFSLQAGGAIMRSVRNLPDDHPTKGFLDYTTTYSENYLNNDVNRFVQWEEISKGCADAEPDAYFFNFNGHTGSFTFNWQGQLKINSGMAWKTQVLRLDPGNPDKITGWKFISDDGTVYTLDIAEQATIVGNGFPCQAGITYNSAWYLSRIASPNGGRTIDFTYENYTQNFTTYSAVTHPVFCYTSTPVSCQTTPDEPLLNLLQMTYACRRVKNITTSDNGATVTFNYTTTRTDEPGTGVKQLDEVVIKNKDATELRKFSFTYDYTTGRLSLRTIKKALTDEPPYKFDYHYEVLPPRIGNSGTMSYGQDHWGYANGKTDNANLLQSVWRRNPNQASAPQIFYKGGDRTPDFSKMTAGMLTKITNPAGGIEVFTYELHEYGSIGNQSVASLGEYVSLAGGVEAKEVYLKTSATAGPRDINLVTPLMWGEYGGEIDKMEIEYRGTEVPSMGDALVEVYDNNAPAGSPPLIQKRFDYPYKITFDFGFLPKGQYRLRAKATSKYYDHKITDTVYDRAEIILRWKSRIYTSVLLKKKRASGVRIASVLNYAYSGDANPVTREYKYDDGTAPTETSSGVLNELPFYESNNLQYYTAGEAQCSYDLRIAYNKAILGYGPHIGYGRVTELSGKDGSNGKTVYTFTSEKEYPATAFKQPPFQQSSFNPYAPGNPTGSSIFKREVDYKAVRESTTTSSHIQSETTVNALKFRFAGGANTAAKFTKGNYEIKFGEWYPGDVVEKEYATDAVNFIQKQKNFGYDNKRLKFERLDLSRNFGGFEEIQYFYADDFVNPTTAIQSMVNKNMIGLPLEIIKSIPNGFSNGIVSGVFNTYGLDASSRVFLSNVKKLQIASTIIVGSYPYAAYNPTGVIDSRYQTEITFEKYDAKENLLQLTGKDGIPTSFLYDKHNTAPVVSASGAAWDKMAWTGFENTNPVTYGGGSLTLNGTYNTTDFATGKRSFSGALSIDLTGFPATSHVLSFWMKGNGTFSVGDNTVTATNTWTLYETRIIPSSSVSLYVNTQGVLLDELRIYPADAQLSTGSYDQLIGQNGVADVKSKPGFYEYDNLWRLHLVKDQNKDIVKRTNYEFEILAPLAYTLNVTQTGNYTYQFQVVGGAAGYVYEWDFDDLSTATSGTASSVSHTFPSLTLTYTVKVKIKNSVNTLAALTKEVTITKTGGSSTTCNEIQNIAVVRNIGNPKQVTFSVPVISGATYWWDFGDNTYANTASATRTYASTPGTVSYNVSITVSAGGKSCSTPTSVKINP